MGGGGGDQDDEAMEVTLPSRVVDSLLFRTSYTWVKSFVIGYEDTSSSFFIAVICLPISRKKAITARVSVMQPSLATSALI